MIFLVIMALKISYTDLRFRKIRNQDLGILVLVAILHHHMHQYLLSASILVSGLLLQKYVGAGDIKYLSLIILMKADFAQVRISIFAISAGLVITSGFYLLKSRNIKMRVPMAPALSVGLLL